MKYSWSYRLHTGMNLMKDERGGVLLSDHPLGVIRINDTAYRLLYDCANSLTLDEIIEKYPGIEKGKIVQFLDSFAKRGILSRIYTGDSIEEYTPFVSIVIPVRNRPADIRRCIESVLCCHYPRDRFEIIVIDDFSTDNETKEAIKEYDVRLIEMEQNVGQSCCRNIGVREAKGEVIAFTDSDCVVSHNWLRLLTQPFVDENIAIVGGGVDSYSSKKALDRYEEVRSPLHMGERGGEIGPGKLIPYIPTCNVFIRRSAFLQVGGFKEEMRVGEDVDLIWRVLQQGNKGWYIPEGRILHRHRNRMSEFIVRRAQYAASEALLEKNFSFNRKKMFISSWNMINGSILLSGIFLYNFLNYHNSIHSFLTIFTFCLVLLLCSFVCEMLVKKSRIKALGFTLPADKIARSLWRSHLAFAGHFTAVLSRYYSLFLLALSIIFPLMFVFWAVVYVLSAYFEYVTKKPELSFPVFILIYIVEMLAYQCGVLRGCCKERNLTPLFHQITII
ncbi:MULTISPECIES: mycofactocin biosynthesis glycosyltransferase MftF [Aneurinibacillus]|uniref:Mycofactocin system glycosyltransferase n=1 Tax=Aneurinibacillus danicus TaxID=267746 RepID=A0A511V6L2_9BACL|nr:MULTISPECIES: mycofactocin biosynthesis glycosyltransferase MftF [Aneurinibacillus]GEN33548.1 mycofactocin system glycosyltransferase [Aneurinibacillus danicus]